MRLVLGGHWPRGGRFGEHERVASRAGSQWRCHDEHLTVLSYAFVLPLGDSMDRPFNLHDLKPADDPSKAPEAAK